MNDLKSLFESDLLTSETKTVLQEAWDTALAAKEGEIEVNYAQKLEEHKQNLTTDSIAMIEEAVADELASISDELVEARTLEIRYATRLNEFKEEYDVKQQEQLKEMVAEVVAEEMSEIHEDVENAKKIQFAMSMFESFQDVFNETFGGEDFQAKSKLEEATNELNALRREKVLGGLVENLTGDSRKVALTILEGVATENLEARFESIRPILLAEAEEVEKKPVHENETTDGNIVLESEEEVVTESATTPTIDPKVASYLSRSLRFGKK